MPVMIDHWTRPATADEAVHQAEAFIRAEAARWAGAPIEFDDLLQEGRIGAWRAWMSYQPGNPWRPWLMRVIRGRIINALRIAQAEKRHRTGQMSDLRFDGPAGPGVDVTLGEAIPGGRDPATVDRFRGRVAAWARTRPALEHTGQGHRVVEPTELEARVIVAALVGVPPAELERTTGDSVKRMDNARQRAIGKLRELEAAA